MTTKPDQPAAAAAPQNQYEAAVRPGSPAYYRKMKRSTPLIEHKFKVGQTLQFTPSGAEMSAPKGAYKIVGHMPSEGGENQYRVKYTLDGHERVVKESQLSNN